MKNRKTVIGLSALLLLLLLLGATGWWLFHERDPMFRGKPESQWIESLEYNDDDQLRRWRGFGREGAEVLARALRAADRPLERAYRRTHRWLRRFVPKNLMGLLPAPRMDATRSTRMRIVDVLSSLGRHAVPVAPMMVGVLDDEDRSVRQLAINYFTQRIDGDVLLNRLDPAMKRRLLPKFIELTEDNGAGVRNNAAVALRHYPEEVERVVPALADNLDDPKLWARQVAANTLYRVAPEQAVEAGAVPAVVDILKQADAQVANRAAELLGKIGERPDLAVPALIEATSHSDSLVASRAARALGNFPSQAKKILPVLKKAMERPEGSVRREAKEALERIRSED